MPHLGVKNLSISCTFWEILAKSYVAPSPSRELAPSPWGNPGSATVKVRLDAGITIIECLKSPLFIMEMRIIWNKIKVMSNYTWVAYMLICS